GLAVLIVEGKTTIGGGMRTLELTAPGFKHDICSAIHPMAVHSPFLTALPLEQFGLEYIHSPIAAAHPLDNGAAAAVNGSLSETAKALGRDEQAYLDLIAPVVEDWPFIVNNILGPLRLPAAPVRLSRFGIKALQSAQHIARKFVTAEA